MKLFRIKIGCESFIKAKGEEEAIEEFCESIHNNNASLGSYIGDMLSIEEIEEGVEV